MMQPATMLLVDDEQPVLDALRRVFRGQYTLTLETDPLKALELIGQQHFDVIISDMRMPGVDGASLLTKAAAHYPHSIRILLTGYSDQEALARAVNKGKIFAYVNKPWDNAQLVELVSTALEQQRLAIEKEEVSQKLVTINKILLQKEQSLQKKLNQDSIELEQAGFVLNMATEQIEQAYHNTIKMLSQVAVSRFKYSHDFLHSVQQHCAALASYCQLSLLEQKNLSHSVLLYQIGKLTFEDAVVACPVSSLSEEGLRQYRRYAEVGADMLTCLPNLEAVAVNIRHLLEQYNGKGWPDKLIGTQIPLGSRILRIVTDYLQSMEEIEGQYRLSAEQAQARLVQRKQSIYDEDMVNAYLQLLPGLNQSREHYDQVLRVHELAAGMVVSRDVLSGRGMMLLSKDSLLSDKIIEQLQQFEKRHNDQLLVYTLPKS